MWIDLPYAAAMRALLGPSPVARSAARCARSTPNSTRSCLSPDSSAALAARDTPAAGVAGADPDSEGRGGSGGVAPCGVAGFRTDVVMLLRQPGLRCIFIGVLCS